MTRFRFSSHKQLLASMVVRDITARYKGSWGGLFWAVANPVLLMLVYYFVFSMIFEVRLPELYDGREAPFAGFIFAGLIVYFMFSEVLLRSSTLISDNTNYVKKVVFPLEIIPPVMVLGAAFNFLVSLVILTLFLLISGHALTPAILVLPLVLIPYLLFLMGLAWLIGALSVYVRDVGYVAGFIATAMMFLSPVFYALQSVPASFQSVMLLNPMTHFIEAFRYCVIGGMVPEGKILLILWTIAVIIFLLGYGFFQRVRHGFADIL